eukprot:TRINITY_DN70999_c1_g1_i1.p1 TRINITY_DN70999_c1_g1~~TRINITY_DN70999_c1_g1_i1.p1  ORF type:complete len:406 (+),score=34.97 TRINITY_DN70999_c1_g1_i1:72-1289(+)
MRSPVSVLVLFTLLALAQPISDNNLEDAQKSVAEYVMSYGYQYEEHKVLTEDGYILTLWRIPGKIGQKSRGQPVLLQHGVLDNGFSFLFQEFNKNLPAMLLKEGYDVWIGNSRGTTRSLEHIDKEHHNWENLGGKYWDFTWDEMAMYDFPSVIEHVLSVTNHEKLKYVCHSQGCAILLAYASSHLEFVNTYIEKVVWLAPGMYVTSDPSWIVHFLFDQLHVLDIVKFVHFKNGLAHPWIMWMSGLAGKYIPRVWLWALNLLCGNTKEEHIDLKRVPVAAANQFGGTSMRNFEHWDQAIHSGEFQMFDFGEEENLKRYGQKTPPIYDVKPYKNFAFPSMVFSFGRDALVHPESVLKFLSKLPEHSYVYEEIPDTNHLSGFWGDFCHKTMYPKIVAFLNNQSLSVIL